jgi:hypothetical protein
MRSARNPPEKGQTAGLWQGSGSTGSQTLSVAAPGACRAAPGVAKPVVPAVTGVTRRGGRKRAWSAPARRSQTRCSCAASSATPSSASSTSRANREQYNSSAPDHSPRVLGRHASAGIPSTSEGGIPLRDSPPMPMAWPSASATSRRSRGSLLRIRAFRTRKRSSNPAAVRPRWNWNVSCQVPVALLPHVSFSFRQKTPCPCSTGM